MKILRDCERMQVLGFEREVKKEESTLYGEKLKPFCCSECTSFLELN